MHIRKSITETQGKDFTEIKLVVTSIYEMEFYIRVNTEFP